jgi:hypothetical protein
LEDELTFDRRGVLAGGAAALLLGAAASAEDSAAEVVARESAAAAAEDRRLLLVFEASWCVWCRQMDAMLEDPAAAAILDRHFRILHLRAQERDEAEIAKQLAGADDVYLRYSGGGAGMPFTAVLDADASAVATSIQQANGGNFGFPVTDEELEGFETMLEVGAPAMPAEDRAALRQVCVRVMDA